MLENAGRVGVPTFCTSSRLGAASVTILAALWSNVLSSNRHASGRMQAARQAWMETLSDEGRPCHSPYLVPSSPGHVSSLAAARRAVYSDSQLPPAAGRVPRSGVRVRHPKRELRSSFTFAIVRQLDLPRHEGHARHEIHAFKRRTARSLHSPG